MTDTNKTSGADVLVSFNVMIDLAKAHLCRADIGDAAKEIFRVEIQDAEKAWQAVAALIGREAAQSAWLELLEDVCERLKSELRTANKSETALVKEVEALAAEVKALREDAERYRWLRDGSAVAPKTDYPVAKLRKAGTTLFIHALDEAIDAARASAATGGGNE